MTAKKIEPWISTIILIILPITANYITAANNIYTAISVLTTILFGYVMHIYSKNKEMKKKQLHMGLMIAFLFNMFFCIAVGWWWTMILWIYISAAFFTVRETKK